MSAALHRAAALGPQSRNRITDRAIPPNGATGVGVIISGDQPTVPRRMHDQLMVGPAALLSSTSTEGLRNPNRYPAAP